MNAHAQKYCNQCGNKCGTQCDHQCYWKYCHYACGEEFENELNYNKHIRSHVCKPAFVRIGHDGLVLGIATIPKVDDYGSRAEKAKDFHVQKKIWIPKSIKTILDKSKF